MRKVAYFISPKSTGEFDHAVDKFPFLEYEENPYCTKIVQRSLSRTAIKTY